MIELFLNRLYLFQQVKASMVIFSLLGALICNAQTHSSTDVPLTVIGNQTGVPSNLTISELKSLFLGETKKWSDGSRPLLVLVKISTPVGISMCKRIFNMRPDEFKRYWLILSFSGKAEPPTFCDSTTELANIVSENAGAIGITDKVEASLNAKIVLIDGKKTF